MSKISLEAFEADLDEALVLVDLRLERSPHWPVMQVMKRQLEAMKRWTASGRTPTQEERGKIIIGLLAARELQDDEALARLCHRLNHFFQVWPVRGEG